MKSFVSFALIVLFFCGCDMPSNPNPPQTATGGAKQVTSLGFTIPKNSQGNTTEQQNILDRTKVTTDTTSVLWIHLIALDGKIIRRMPVRCKVTSSGKRLEPAEAERDGSQNAIRLPETVGGKYYTKELIQPDGTYGSSDQYIYWFDPMGRYHQYGTAGGIGYLLTNYPIDLEDPVDAITGLYNMSQAAHKWQLAQEAELRKKESK